MEGLRHQQGFNMIEVMVAIAVFSLGLISIAGLSITNLQNASHGLYESQATIIARQWADGMRSNLQAYENGLFASNLDPGEKSCFGGAECNYDEAAHYDSDTWLQNAASALPGGVVIICMDSTPADGSPTDPACDGLGLNTIKLFWIDSQKLESEAGADDFYRHVLSLVP
jgi:type IV pilus assembly protein PilV